VSNGFSLSSVCHEKETELYTLPNTNHYISDSSNFALQEALTNVRWVGGTQFPIHRVRCGTERFVNFPKVTQ
jgi:hypothetical protein